MKKEEEFDLYGWKSNEPANTYEVTCKNGDVHDIEAHEFIVGEPQPTLKLVSYGKVLLDRVDTIGGSKNQTMEFAQELTTIAWIVAAFLPGEWLSVLNTAKRTAFVQRPPTVSID